jgi:cbb3-type cytochrome oxidase cytochrome c subunit
MTRRRVVRVLLPVALLAAGACASEGRELFVEKGCVGCHRFRGPGGGLGPDLSDVGSRLDAAAIRSQLRNPGRGNPASRMPSFRSLSWFEVESLVAYLRS